MEHTSSSHDNVDVRVHNKITIYGNVTMIGSLSVAGVGFLFLGIWVTHYWSQALVLSAIMVYGLMGLFGLALLAGVAALWVRFVLMPGAEAYERTVMARGQDQRNHLIHAQENAIVLVQAGQLQVVPLLPQPVVEANPTPITTDDSTIIDLYEQGMALRDICTATGETYYRVQKTTSDYDKRKNRRELA